MSAQSDASFFVYYSTQWACDGMTVMMIIMMMCVRFKCGSDSPYTLWDGWNTLDFLQQIVRLWNWHHQLKAHNGSLNVSDVCEVEESGWPRTEADDATTCDHQGWGHPATGSFGKVSCRTLYFHFPFYVHWQYRTIMAIYSTVQLRKVFCVGLNRILVPSLCVSCNTSKTNWESTRATTFLLHVMPEDVQTGYKESVTTLLLLPPPPVCSYCELTVIKHSKRNEDRRELTTTHSSQYKKKCQNFVWTEFVIGTKLSLLRSLSIQRARFQTKTFGTNRPCKVGSVKNSEQLGKEASLFYVCCFLFHSPLSLPRTPPYCIR